MQSDNAIPTLTPPAYPSIAGQVMPDLNLAGISTPQTSLAEGHFTGSTPPQNTAVPPLNTDDVDGDINQLGIDPAVNYFELNLAGNVLPIPDPAKLAMPTPPSPSQEQANAPTFSGPFASVPSIRAFDLTSPGIDAIAPFDADPATGDLLQFDRPRGLFMLAASELPMIADPMLPDLSLYDRPAGLDMPGPLMVDPALPDLQHPTLEQPVAMPGRPADLAPDALAMMHGLPAYEQLPAAHSKALWMAQQGVMHIAGHICEGQTLDARGHDVRVTIIKGGKSINGYYYDEQALQHIAHMIDGARAYADHGRSEADQQTRSVRDMVGFYKDAQHFPHAAGSPHGRVDATLHMLEAAAWLWSIIQEAVALDRPDLIGLSIDIFGNWQPSEERQAKQVTRVLSLNSCDNSDTSQAETPDQSRIMEAQQAAIQAALAEISREKCALRLERRLMESQLPEAAQQHLRQQFGERIFENTELETSMSNLRSMLAGLGASGIITGNGYEKPATGHMISEAEKIQAAFDGMFDLEYGGTVMDYRGLYRGI